MNFVTEFEKIVKETVNNKNIFGAVFNISSLDGSLDFTTSAGKIKDDDMYYIASINKLFVSAVILRLVDEGRIKLSEKIVNYFPDGQIDDIHILKGVNYSKSITIEHLLSMTSGLPCYLTDKLSNGKVLLKELELGNDQRFNNDKVIDTIKSLPAHFVPGQKGKAKYIDTGHQILSEIAEIILGNSMVNILTNLFKELGMNSTHVITNINDTTYKKVYYRENEIEINKYASSTKNDIVSTAKDQMKFIKAFFNGAFYNKSKINELEKWNRIFFPFKYGIGIQQFYTPRIFTLFKKLPTMIGHSGSVGAVAFYIPQKNIFITGTTNQQSQPSAAFRAMMKMMFKMG